MLTDRLKQDLEICALAVASSAGIESSKLSKLSKTEINSLFAIHIKNIYRIDDLEIILIKDYLLLRRFWNTFWSTYVVRDTDIEESQNDKKYNLDTGWIRIYRWLKEHAN